MNDYEILLGKRVLHEHYFNIDTGSSSGKALGYGLDGPGLILGVGGVETFLHSFVSRLVLRSTQPRIK